VKAATRYVFQFDPSSREIRVEAELDGGVRVPFILDTGATSCSLPGWAAKAMDLQIDADTPRVAVVGISGESQIVPQVQVQSLAIGELVVENVEMHVLDTMQEGLLGMPFFNHFKVALDPTAGTLTLEPIDSDTREDAFEGKNEQTWRAEFKQRREALEAVRSKIASIGHEYVTIRERLEEREVQLRKQLEELEDRATRAGVPQSWRG
jgi:clan AA aspartic protease (TIGR02281 family)